MAWVQGLVRSSRFLLIHKPTIVFYHLPANVTERGTAAKEGGDWPFSSSAEAGKGRRKKVVSAAGAAERRVLGLLVTSEVQTRGKGREGKVAGIWRLEGNRVWPRCPLLVGTSGWSGSRER